jgi:hypothetical protein
MLITRQEVDRLKAIVRDIDTGLIPGNIVTSVLSAFFAENPHLLMTNKFDEHTQRPTSGPEREALDFLAQNTTMSGLVEFELPLLEFRVPSGRWSGLIGVPYLSTRDGKADGYDFRDYFVFSFGMREALNSMLRVNEETPDEEFKAVVNELTETVYDRSFNLRLDKLVADLETRVKQPREKASVLWTPKLWLPAEQARQKALLDLSLGPHFEKWKSSGIHFDDLNPSEFEDLVGEVLLSAGLRIYKVRHAPQGGRDLIARGTLIPGEEQIEMAVEVKHRSVVDRPQVELALHQNKEYPALVFATSGRFTAGVLQEKAREENRFRLFLKDGAAIGDLVRQHFRLEQKLRNRILNRND